ncbi:Bgt-1125 [Blumeria graminis f. sp. tritici]|uniref:1-phosphatidylinositol 4-kinase n=2 Tax=Blumeria graminis f. sp. tritici TaxID=62690 RepID=A0A061HEN1_BLUGR|nr:Phosphatidylinositol 4-kinase [Blumeria graminis f. sp. tritici 96224]VDB96387.1 Bgt-1125 [Blumeria graminis f. sp. tritici]
MSWNLLKRFIESDVFNQSPFLSVAYLSRYADHVGIHYVLCSKLRQFRYEEIEFFLPQLCHLIISVNNESMALEEFILDLCEDSVNAALLTFWLFQTYLHDLSSNPQSESFKTCRRIFNKVQHVVFGVSDQTRSEKISENILPVTVLSSFIFASIAAPFLPKWAGPLAIGQARKPQPAQDSISEASQTQQRIHRSNTTHSALSRPQTTGCLVERDNKNKPQEPSKLARATSLSRTSSPSSLGRGQSLDSRPRPTHLDLRLPNTRRCSSSLPSTDFGLPTMNEARPITPVTACIGGSSQFGMNLFQKNCSSDLSTLSEAQKVKLLRQNYFRCEAQFITALEDISNRLVVVPKAARLSALRAELALIAQDLPAEVDIPVICPATLVDGQSSKSRHHRIVRLNPTEATVLNSAEKVPYLLMVEVLRDDFSFDPSTSYNQALLTRLMAEQGLGQRRIFDISESARAAASSRKNSNTTSQNSLNLAPDNVSRLSLLSPRIVSFPSDDKKESLVQPFNNYAAQLSGPPSPWISGNLSMSCLASPIDRRMTFPQTERIGTPDQPDFSAVATHMRTASQMLTQLQSTSGKRPKHEVAAIRAKIIASMQSLDEKSFEVEDIKKPSFDDIKMDEIVVVPEASESSLGNNASDSTENIGAGAARMENDQKTSGFQRKGDSDDPSAATFGEAWSVKKERIRKTSPYGWMKNWDVLSVIVKTGADLRQEAFACQLIQVCDDIWKDAKTPVWVERMRILVTGESSGLIETITNGVSLHSLKRSLTLEAIETGQNPRGKIASLKDHFVKVFGPPESSMYQAAADAFKRSLAAYSIISYVLQLKDRHNGNVLIDNEGHIIHIDFGFMLSNSPGSVGFEAAPFKLTQDYVEVLGGVGSEHFEDYKSLCKQAFQALRRSADHLIDLVNIMGRESKMPCFSYGVQQAVANLRQRFQLQLSADEAEQFVETDLIGKNMIAFSIVRRGYIKGWSDMRPCSGARSRGKELILHT